MVTKPWYVKKPISFVKKPGFSSSVRHVTRDWLARERSPGDRRPRPIPVASRSCLSMNWGSSSRAELTKSELSRKKSIFRPAAPPPPHLRPNSTSDHATTPPSSSSAPTSTSSALPALAPPPQHLLRPPALPPSQLAPRSDLLSPRTSP
jgi:hypothetical protein